MFLFSTSCLVGVLRRSGSRKNTGGGELQRSVGRENARKAVILTCFLSCTAFCLPLASYELPKGSVFSLFSLLHCLFGNPRPDPTFQKAMISTFFPLCTAFSRSMACDYFRKAVILTHFLSFTIFTLTSVNICIRKTTLYPQH